MKSGRDRLFAALLFMLMSSVCVSGANAEEAAAPAEAPAEAPAAEAAPAPEQAPAEPAPAPPPAPKGIMTPDIDLVSAMRVVEAAQKKAAEIDTKMDIAVVDAGANLKAFIRMDEAWLGSIDIAIKKAKTSRFFNFETGVIGELSQPGGPLFNIEHSNGGLITFPGGVPLKNEKGDVIGAIGVSGSTVENDHAVAVAGAAAL